MLCNLRATPALLNFVKKIAVGNVQPALRPYLQGGSLLFFCKPGRDPELASSYRPIIPQSGICKLVEKMLMPQNSILQQVLSNVQLGGWCQRWHRHSFQDRTSSAS